MDFEIKEIELRQLRPNCGEVDGLPRNPRKISKKNLEKLKKSLKDAPEMLRLRELIVIPNDDGYVVIAGNQRLDAAKAVGMTTLPCKVLPEDTDPVKLREYAIKDNLPFGEDDWEVIASDWDTAELEEWGMSVPSKWKDAQEAEEDDFDPDSMKETVCKRGDIWQLGDHRLMCGDSTDAGDVALLMEGEKADMVFTDPPYNANYKSRGRDDVLKKGIKNDNLSDDEFNIFIKGFIVSIKSCIQKGASIYICCNWKDSYPRMYFECVNNNINISNCIIWNKKNGGMGWNDYRYQYEMIIYGFDKTIPHNFYGGRNFTDVWDFSRAAVQTYAHPTQKPVEIPFTAIKNSCHPSGSVLDLFGGSGTTLIAAEQLNRKCYMMELEPHYCDVIIARWEKFTGKKAIKIN